MMRLDFNLDNLVVGFRLANPFENGRILFGSTAKHGSARAISDLVQLSQDDDYLAKDGLGVQLLCLA